MSSGINRPFKYGANDRREFIVQNSEVAYRAINDANGNPTYLARAKCGTATSVEKWQIRKITYDANQGVTAIEWPQDGGLASADFIFEWDEVLTYVFS
jgi:hypothetical protein